MKRSFNQANLTSDNPPGLINPSVLELINKIDSTNRNIKGLSEYLKDEQIKLTQNDIMIQCNDIQDSITTFRNLYEKIISNQERSMKIDDYYQWENRVKDEPLDLVSVQPWYGWTAFGDKCNVCSGKPFKLLYEVHFQWGDTPHYEYIRNVCKDCLHKVNRDFVRNKSTKY